MASGGTGKAAAGLGAFVLSLLLASRLSNWVFCAVPDDRDGTCHTRVVLLRPYCCESTVVGTGKDGASRGAFFAASEVALLSLWTGGADVDDRAGTCHGRAALLRPY